MIHKLKKFNAQPNPYLCYCQYLKDKYSAQISAEEIIKLRYEIAQDFLQNIIDYKPQAELNHQKIKSKEFYTCYNNNYKTHKYGYISHFK